MTTEDTISVVEMDGEKDKQKLEDLIRSLKVTKSRAKGNFTKQKNS